MNKVTVIVYTLILVVLGILMFVIPFPYNSTEVYTEKEPYDTQEKYTEQEVEEACANQPYEYSAGFVREEFFPYPSSLLETEIKIKNLENEPGDFILKIYYFDENKHPEDDRHDYTEKDVDLESIAYLVALTPYESENVVVKTTARDRDADYTWQIFKITPPIIEKCETKLTDVEKSRTVTKYKEVNKTRIVTRFAPLVKQWLNY